MRLSTKVARILQISSIMATSTMISLDATIANVALPHIQNSTSAGHDEIAWVLTSYLVAVALAAPLTGWLAGKLGRKRLLVIAAIGFTIASMLCGLAVSLPQLVAFRILQGLVGASIMPLTQAVMLDLYPRERHGQAMALWGMGTILGPIAGPVLGGFLTEALSWRWVFYINLPIGLMATIGILSFVPREARQPARAFDFVGFTALVAFIAALQLILDRGPGQGWLSSMEIRTYLVIAIVGFVGFVGHTLRASHPFFDPGLTRDRNFIAASILGFVVALLLLSTVALLPAMMQGAMGRSALEAGYLMVPRGFGVLAAMFVTSRLMARFDSRLILAFGLGLTAVANWQMAHFTLETADLPLMLIGFVHGLGLGVIFVPMTTIAFSTVPEVLRAEATTANNILRNLGGSVGISVMQALLVADTRQALAEADARSSLSTDELGRQALMMAYVNDFQLMVLIVTCSSVLLLAMRPAQRMARRAPPRTGTRTEPSAAAVPRDGSPEI
jgi:DHA2 family multidrug resistance protein